MGLGLSQGDEYTDMALSLADIWRHTEFGE